MSKTDNSDLIASGDYSLDSLRIVPFLIDPNKPGPLIRIEPDTGFGYNILLRADKNTAGYAIQLDTLPPDTLLVTTLQSEGGDCCAGMTEFETLTLNGVEIPNDYTVCCINILK